MSNESSAIKRPYAIADYRDSSRYPSPSLANLKIWRWEFLRRNVSYQAFFAEHKVGGYVPGCEEFGLMQLFNPRDDEAPSYGTTLAPGIVSLPTIASVEHRRNTSPRYDAEKALADVLGFTTEVQAGSNVLAVLDRRLPLDEQLASIHRLILKMNAADKLEPIFQRMRVDKWPEYLRVLDGRAAGEKFGRIASVLHPNEDKDATTARVKQAHKAAIALSTTFGIGREPEPEN